MTAAILSIWLALFSVVETPPRSPDTVAVCPAEFRSALQPWIDFRTRQGHDVTIVSSTGSPEDVRDRIRAVARRADLKFIVLVGGAGSRQPLDPLVRARSVPVHLETAKVNIRWGSEPQIASDGWYADLKGDGLPSAAIGRLTVESADELSHLVKKILHYETNQDAARWRARVNFVAGVGGFSPVVDAVLESTVRRMISSGVPAGYQTTLTYANWRSSYCPDPRLFRSTIADRLNEGCLFWVYMGHANPTRIDGLRTPLGSFPGFDRRDAGGLRCAAGSPIAIFLSCYSGAFDAQERCLGDELLRSDGGPVAVIGGSRVTMPYGMSVLGTEFMDECFERHSATIGEAMLRAKRRTVAVDDAVLSSRRLMLDTLARAVSPKGSDLAAERAEHLHLFNLLGDPLLRFSYPRQATVSTTSSTVAGLAVNVTGQAPLDGVCTLELLADEEAANSAAPPRQQFDGSAAALAAYQPAYLQANRRRLAAVETPVTDGHFSTRIDIPATAAGHCQLAVFVAGKSDCAVGATNLEVERPASRR